MPFGTSKQHWLGVAAALLGVCLLVALATPFLARQALDRPVSRDEHQFVASATLLARQGLLPYRDYPYFHVPYQVAAQAFAIRLGLSPLVGGRLVSLVCGLGCLLLLFAGGLYFLRDDPWYARLPAAATLPVLMSLNTLFLYTTGRTWNHDLSVMLALAAFLAHCRALSGGRPRSWYLASGLLLGLATGVRLSWGPLLLPFLAAVYWLGERRAPSRGWREGLPFLGGFMLAALPGLAILAAFPGDTFFGAVTYSAKLNTLFRAEGHYTKAMNIFSKLKYFDVHVNHGAGNYHLFGTYYQNRVLFAATGYLALPLNLIAAFKQTRRRGENILLLAILPMIMLGSMLPTPSMYQYYYQLVPFCLLALALGAANLLALVPLQGLRAPLASALAVLAGYVLLAGGHCLLSEGWGGQATAGQYQSGRVHRLGQDLARALPPGGKVLTLSPIYPLEGGLDIYPEMATGPFALRVAHLLSQEERKARRMVAPADLEDFLAEQPPAGILTGQERDTEQALVAYAQAHGYRPHGLAGPERLTLWTPGSTATSSEAQP